MVQMAPTGKYEITVCGTLIVIQCYLLILIHVMRVWPWLEVDTFRSQAVNLKQRHATVLPKNNLLSGELIFNSLSLPWTPVLALCSVRT